MRIVAQLLSMIVIAAVGWVVLGYLATAPLGAIYGWSGHPSMPAAPWSLYVALYAFVLPAVCLAAGWYVAAWIVGAIWRRSVAR